MKNKDLVFSDQLYKFNFRVAMLPIKDNKILLQKCSNDDYYSLPGGRVKFGESTIDTIKREISEELGLKIVNDRLNIVKVIENFYNLKGKEVHEILFVYKYDASDFLDDEYKNLDKDNSFFYWFDINRLSDINLKPIIIKNCINSEILSHLIIK